MELSNLEVDTLKILGQVYSVERLGTAQFKRACFFRIAGRHSGQKYRRSVRFLSVRPTRRPRCPFVWSLVTFTAHVHHLIKEMFDSVNITVKVTLLPFVMSKEPVGRYLGTL